MIPYLLLPSIFFAALVDAAYFDSYNRACFYFQYGCTIYIDRRNEHADFYWLAPSAAILPSEDDFT